MADQVGYTLGEGDVKLVQELLDDYRKRVRRGNVTPPAGEEITAPEVYVAKIPAGGIPARSSTTPGSADCQLYRLIGSDPDNSTIVQLGVAFRRVYNLLTTAIDVTDEWVLVIRDKFGRWFVAQGGTGGESSILAVLTAKDYTQPFVAYSWRRVLEVEGDEHTAYELVPASDTSVTGTGTSADCGTHDGVTSGAPGCWPAYSEQDIDLVIYRLQDEDYTGTGTAPDGYIPPECVVRMRRGRGDWWLIDHEPRWELVVKDTTADALIGPNGVSYYPAFLLTYDQYNKVYFVKQEIFLIDSSNYTG